LNPRSFSKTAVFKTLRLMLALVPIVWIFSKINYRQLAHALASTAWWTLPLLSAIIVIGMFLQGIRWWFLMRPFASMLTLATTLKAHFIGLYYSIVLPTSAAQNVIRAFILAKSIDYSVSWASSWISGVLGLLTLAVLSTYGLIHIEHSTLPPGFFESIVSAYVVLFLLVVLSFSKRFTGLFRILFRKLLPHRVLAAIENIREAVYKYRGKGATLVFVFFLTLFMQVMITGAGCLVIYGISGKILLAESLLYLPIIEILCAALPLAPNGIGVREALLALMFRQVGLSNEQLGIYIVFGYFSILLKLTGGIPLMFKANAGMRYGADKLRGQDTHTGSK
jgi:uncharacterized protein (TIRG00374 family)